MPRIHTLSTPVLCTAALIASAALAAGLVHLSGPPRAVAAAPAQEPTPNAPARLTFDDLFEEERTGRRPAQTAWHPDGVALTYVWDDGDGQALWRMEAATGETTRLLEVAELAPSAPGERTESGLAKQAEQDGRDEGGDRSGEAETDPEREGEAAGGEETEEAEAPTLDAYHWSPAGDALLLESGGDLWLLRPGAEDDRRLARLTATEAAEEDPAISPDGTKVAYVREADLYLLELPGASAREAQRPSGEPGAVPEAAGAGPPSPPAERALTTDGEPGTTLNGTTSWVYWEEIWGRDATGFWWSPDSSRIAYYRFDETPVGEYTLLPDYRPEYPETEVQRYPKAGTTNPEVRLGILELAGGGTTWLETDAPEEEESYLARLHWTPDGSRVAVERLNREQNRLDLLLCDPAGGACETALTDGHPTWVNLGKETTFLPDGRLLWASERTGWRHLYLYSAPEDGLELLGALTSGPWAVTSVDLAEDGQVFAAAHGTGTLGAARRRLLRIRFRDGTSLDPRVEVLAGGGDGDRGWHSGQVAPGGGHLLHRWSHADDPGWERIEAIEASGDGAPARVTAELPSEPPAYDPAALPSWRFLEVPGPDGTALPAALLEPAGAGGATQEREQDGEGGETGGRPVIMYHYGGPGSQVVVDRWSTRGRALWHKMMAQRGFGVLMVDNPASVFFGKAGEDLQHRRFGEVNLAAQRAGAAYLETLPWADPARVGLWGWSGGGANTLYCLLRSPGTWSAGVAGAPVTDWRYYDTIWTERYLDHPDDNPEGYRASSPRTYAGELRDRLLIVHGTADDNVHPQHTMALAQDWTEAGIPFEMAIHPGEKHGFGDDASRHFYERMTGFFERTLRER